MSAEGTQTEFDFSEFETGVSEEDIDVIIGTIADSIDRLREQIDDDFLDGMFQHDPGRYILKSEHSRDQLDPEKRFCQFLFVDLNAGTVTIVDVHESLMDITIREATPEDAPRIRDVHLASIKQLGPRAYDSEQVNAWAHDRGPASYPIETAETYVIVADTGDRIVGFGWLRYDANEYFHAQVDGEITATYVSPSVARRGVGTRIHDRLEHCARQHQLDSLGLWSSLNAVPFYRAQGYVRITEHTLAFDEDVRGRVVEMRKELESHR